MMQCSCAYRSHNSIGIVALVRGGRTMHRCGRIRSCSVLISASEGNNWWWCWGSYVACFHLLHCVLFSLLHLYYSFRLFIGVHVQWTLRFSALLLLCSVCILRTTIAPESCLYLYVQPPRLLNISKFQLARIDSPPNHQSIRTSTSLLSAVTADTCKQLIVLVLVWYSPIIWFSRTCTERLVVTLMIP